MSYYNPAVQEGVGQVHGLWREGMSNTSNIDKSMIWDAFSGLRQFGFNDMKGSALGDALFQIWFSRALEIWGPDQESLDEFFETTLGFFSHEKPMARSVAELKGIRVPVKLIQGSENIINNSPGEYLDKFGELLREAGVRFETSVIPSAPHCLCVDHSETLNPILHDFVLKASRGSVPSPPSHVISPWEELLRGAGYTPEDDDELIIHHPHKLYSCRPPHPV
ncbi:hypothetical protein V5O48_000960 [Marasmius crinis-equi]|uniref:Uncharacterized protein n=1 Tax=Marasmius crinis-equi TaxID=585013 RepID=A0ABR3G082_9AGAR